MKINEAYDLWAGQYDTNENKTRDLEALSLKKALNGRSFRHCLEIGCGTGKNTASLLDQCTQVTAVDFSEAMLAKAKMKNLGEKVQFVQADITREWEFAVQNYDLVTFSLVLEHIEDIDAILNKVSAIVPHDALVYIGELHPFKQYSGSKAKFDDGNETTVVTCYTHHVSDFTKAAKNHGFVVDALEEYFDNDDRQSIPRILSILFRRQV